MSERLQKIIARSGRSSRRAAEDLILAGRVRVNGQVVTELGAKADPFQDKVEVDGDRLVAEDLVYCLLHKPRNVVSTLQDPEGRPTVAEYFKTALTRERGPKGGALRVYPVGRLDFATSGALLATNDGEFAQALLHPKKGVPKLYVVKVRGAMKDEDLERWRRGVDLEDGRTLPAQVRFLRHEGAKTWFEITLKEGRNHQIRRMGEATGFFVMRLARLSFAGISNEGLRPGEMRLLTVAELTSLKESYGVPRRIPKGSPRSAPRAVTLVGAEVRRAAGRRSGAEPKPDAPNKTAAGKDCRDERPASGRAEPARVDKPTRARKPERPFNPERAGRPTRAARPTREKTEPAKPEWVTKAERAAEKAAERGVRSERTDRSGTKPRAAGRPAPRAPARAGLAKRPKRT